MFMGDGLHLSGKGASAADLSLAADISLLPVPDYKCLTK